MKMTLVRHGEVEHAYLKCYNGHNNIALSKQGVKEATAVAERLQEYTYDALFYSDLKRTTQTAQLINHTLNITNTFATKALREKSWGRHEGLSFNEIIDQEPFHYENFSQWIHALDGENYEDYIQRIHAYFTQEIILTPYNNVLVVTHAGVIRVLMHLLQNISLEEAFSIHFPYHASITLDTTTWTFGAITCA